ncbi:UMP kinase [Simkania negevensis]|uniref:Uridylate kinase n=1 Tax=Simkania negevensis TaxID=83561 RepID=A0ABS3AR10_9BACT|nr:UMP kinase [Simkania negevensis]
MSPLTGYRRVLLKLSGEALSYPETQGIHRQSCDKLVQSILALRNHSVEIGIVIGGGNLFRGVQAEQLGIDRIAADDMGMLATIINGIALQQAIELQGGDCRVMSAIDCPAVVERFSWEKAIGHMKKGRIVVFVGGTGNPFFTTDTGAALRASQIHADILLKGTKVDGVYDKDPKKFSDAVKYTTLTCVEALEKEIKVMDATAFALCMDNGIPIRVFNLFDQDSLLKAVSDECYGTLVTKD